MATTTERQGKFKFHCTVGLLLRGHFKFQLEVYAKRAGLKLETIEHKGWIETTFYIELHGGETNLRQAAKEIPEWVERMNAE